MNRPVRIIIMEPVSLLRFSLSTFIREHYGSGVTVIAEVKDLFELREAMMSTRVDVILTALFGDRENLEHWWKFEEFITRCWPEVPCLAWSDIPKEYLQRLNRRGALSCYVNKTVSLMAFNQLLDKILASSPPRFPLELPVRGDPKAVLTRHELDVVHRLCQGESLKGIAWALERSIKTISAHKCNAMRKLGVRSTAMLLKLQKPFVHVKRTGV